MRARPISCCFSGHRPGKLPWGDDEGDRRCLALKERLWNEMEAAYEQGYRHFICGMAQGCDLYFCELALALRQLHGDVTVEECHFHGSRTEIREQSAMEALDLLRRCILKYCG